MVPLQIGVNINFKSISGRSGAQICPEGSKRWVSLTLRIRQCKLSPGTLRMEGLRPEPWSQDTIRPWKLGTTDIEKIYPNGRTQQRFSCWETVLESAFVTKGHMPAIIADFMPSEGEEKVEHSNTESSQMQDSYKKRKRWRELGHLLGTRQMLFGLILTDPVTRPPEHKSLLSEELFLPSDATKASLRFRGDLSLSVEQLERVRLFHLSLMWLLHGQNTLADPSLTRFGAWCSTQLLNILIVPLRVNIPPPVPIMPLFDIHTKKFEYNVDVTTLVDFDKLDTFLATRENPAYNPTVHSPGTIVRTSYSPAPYVLIDRLPGEGNDTELIISVGRNSRVMSLAAELDTVGTAKVHMAVGSPQNMLEDDEKLHFTVREYLSQRWGIPDLPETNTLLIVNPLTTKVKLSTDSFPTASKWVLTVAGHTRKLLECADESVSAAKTPLWYASQADRVSVVPSFGSLREASKAFGSLNPPNLQPEKNVFEADPTLRDRLIQAAATISDKVGKKLHPSLTRALPVSLHDLNYATYLPSIIIALQRRIAALGLHFDITGFTEFLRELKQQEFAASRSDEECTNSNNSREAKPLQGESIHDNGASHSDLHPSGSSKSSPSGTPNASTSIGEANSQLSPLSSSPPTSKHSDSSASKPSGPFSLESLPVPIRLSTMEEALTCPSASISRNYERLETLGDTVLKFIVSWYLFITMPEAGEGAMTNAKMRAISNKFLARAHRAHWLQDKCFMHQLCMDVKRIRGRSTLPLKGKADLCESALGHFFFNYGEAGARVFLAWLDEDYCELIQKADEIRKQGEQAHYIKAPFGWAEIFSNGSSSPDAPPSTPVRSPEMRSNIDISSSNNAGEASRQHSSSTGERHSSSSIPQSIQQIHPILQDPNFGYLPSLKYTFKRKHLLATALTHASAKPRPTLQTFERLEFLGDACLDLLVVCDMFQREELTPGEMSTHRSQIAGNSSYAFMCVLMDFHWLLIHDSTASYQEIQQYFQNLHKLTQEYGLAEGDIRGLLGRPQVRAIRFPGALSDMFEAIAGAIFVDLEWDINAFAKVWNPVIQELVKTHFNHDLHAVRNRHPSLELALLMRQHDCVALQTLRTGNRMTQVWHGLVLAEHTSGDNTKHDQMILSQLALDTLKERPFLWQELCDCPASGIQTLPSSSSSWMATPPYFGQY